ncbi:MAG: glycosyltransferase [Bacillota bacterium]|nr:glycosyltransferase [Bacillota bacterium]
MKKLTIGLFNDSFPPTVDGVANTVLNYAKVIEERFGKSIVATPKYPRVSDYYPFKVIRYPSAFVGKRIGYRMGYPFNPKLITRLVKEDFDLIHVHSPFVSMVLARVVRKYAKVPIVFTYHTKFDIDIQKRLATKTLRKASVKFILSNINASDEVWVVSNGAGENLKSLGYTGNYRVMVNGTDFVKGKSTLQEIKAFSEKYSLSDDELTMLFVGRMMWYKNIKLIVDALSVAKSNGAKFKMFFVGEGADRTEIMDYVKEMGLDEHCIFTGLVMDREELRLFYSRAELFLFPSTYDTNGIVVREAAACECPALLIENSCAAEGIENGFTGLIVREDAESIGSVIHETSLDLARIRKIGVNASEHVYFSWTDAVEKAYARYVEILKK